jgi:hypothetical protein
MSSRTGRLAGRLVLLSALGVLPWALGCGKQGPPLPPLRAVPAPVKDLTVVQQGNRLLMTFSYPQVTPAGTALQGISAVEIFSASLPAPGGTATPIDPRSFAGVAKPLQKVEGADLTSATAGSRIEISLPLPVITAPAPSTATTTPAPPAAGATGTAPATGTTTTTTPPGPTPLASYYAVRTYGREGDKSDLSNVAFVVPKTPPTAPTQVTVTPRGDGVLIEWAPVEGAAAGYNIYRRGAQERSSGKAIHTSGPQERSWLDTTARFGQSYIYSVTALAQATPLIESSVGSDHEVRYIDRFAPPPPTELVALAEARRVRLVWRPAEADDLAGYVVYRRVGESGAFARVTPQPVVSAEFVDTAVTAGQTYTYRVTAVDQTGNESAPGGEVRANVP